MNASTSRPVNTRPPEPDIEVSDRAPERIMDLAGLHAMGLGVLGAVTLAAYGLLIAPQREAREAYAEAQRERAELDLAVAENYQNLRDAAAQEASLRSELARAVVLRDPDRPNAHIRALRQLANASGLDVRTAEPGDIMSDRPQFAMVPITLQGVGSPSQVAAFLDALNREVRDVEVRQVALQADTAQTPAVAEGTPRVEFTLGLVWFTLPRPDRSAAAGASGGS